MSGPAVSYAKHGTPAYASDTARGCEMAGEPVFLLRAQDELAAETVRCWAAYARAAGRPEMAAEADRIAEAMAAWPARKLPD